MSLVQATALIERMKSDKTFHDSILASGCPNERMAKWSAEGFDCTIEDIKALQTVFTKVEVQKGSLPLTWQAGGPCHTKCAPIMQ
jgi:predicted ribosomally synthesized peptide with nif11-like leader